jgi:hypothetical protein
MSYEHEAEVCGILEEKYKKKGRDFKFKSRIIAKELRAKEIRISSYEVRNILMKMEKEDMIGRTLLSSTTKVWQTKFKDKDNICRCGIDGRKD